MKFIKMPLRVGILILPLIAAALIAACNQPVSETGRGTGNVLIKTEKSNGRTILPSVPVFSNFELTLQKDGEDPVDHDDVDGIDQDGVRVSLTEGTWTITLKAYQDVLNEGEPVLAAVGSKEVIVEDTTFSKVVVIELKPLAFSDPSAGLGVFSYTVLLPEDVETAELTLRSSEGVPVPYYHERNLLDNLSGSASISPDYYDLSVILTKNGQSAGLFESVHIYSGLRSDAELDLRHIVFDDKVYIMGTIGGVRLGGISIETAGGGVIKSFEAGDEEKGDFFIIRDANWAAEISSAYVGQTVYAVQEFDGERVSFPIAPLPAAGIADVVLTLLPSNVDLVNVAPLYSRLTVENGTGFELAVNGGAGYWTPNGNSWLELDFGFDVTVNAFRLIFTEACNAAYTVSYDNGGNWVPLKTGSTADSRYTGFFGAQTAQKFKLEISGGAGVVEFGLYKAADRGTFLDSISAAEANSSSAAVSVNGSDILVAEQWVTQQAKDDYLAAIAAARIVYNDPTKTAGEAGAAQNALAEATAAFNNAKQWGKKVIGIVSYTWTTPADETITLSETETLFWKENDTLNVSVLHQTFGAYQWYVDGKIKTGATGNMIILYAREFSLGKHTAAVKVTANGKPYTKTLIFTVK